MVGFLAATRTGMDGFLYGPRFRVSGDSDLGRDQAARLHHLEPRCAPLPMGQANVKRWVDNILRL